MATITRNSVDLVHDLTTDARFRAFIQFIMDVLVAGGWTQTADTGQLNIATITRPLATNTKMGYVVFAMGDAMQATKPIFVRFDFGSGGITGAPATWVTIGTGSSGAGVITGMMFNGGAVASATFRGYQSQSTAIANSYGSADGGRIQVHMFSSTAPYIFSINRTIDGTGAYTGAGVLLAGCNSQGSVGALSWSQFAAYVGGGGNPLIENGVSTVLSNQTNSGFGTNIGIGLLLYFSGEVLQPPGDIVIVNSGDFGAEAQFQMSLYGVTRTFQLGNFAGSNCYIALGAASLTLRNNTRIGIRFD